MTTPHGHQHVLAVDEAELLDLEVLLSGALGELSMEISDTDNAGYRAELKHRRDRLAAVHAKVTARLHATPAR